MNYCDFRIKCTRPLSTSFSKKAKAPTNSHGVGGVELGGK